MFKFVSRRTFTSRSNDTYVDDSYFTGYLDINLTTSAWALGERIFGPIAQLVRAHA